MCAWHHFNKCSIDQGVHISAEQNMKAVFDTLQRTWHGKNINNSVIFKVW